MIGFGPVSRPPPCRAAVMRAGANGPAGGGSTSENHRMRDVWPHWNRLPGRQFPLAGSSSKVAKSRIVARNPRKMPGGQHMSQAVEPLVPIVPYEELSPAFQTRSRAARERLGVQINSVHACAHAEELGGV